MTDDPAARLSDLVAQHGEAVPLDEACLLVAAHAHPGLDIAAERARLDSIAAGVSAPTVDAVCSHLIDDLGFTGDSDGYHDARNALLPDVLDRRSGMPLTLAVVAMEVGRRCGVTMLGVGMPGHFLLRPAEEDARFIDIFDGRARLDRADCRGIFGRLHADATWDDRFLDPVAPLAIVTRMLLNLANSYRRSGERRALASVMDMRLVLPDATERDHRELALLLGASGRYDAAADVLEATGRQRDQESAARMRARLN
ncbi:MAG: SirB1 family protein [Actinomycetota bacterium]